MPSNHLILCCPLLFLPSICPSIRVFSNESILHIKWPKYWSFSFHISPSNDTQDWYPLGWTGWISLQFKGLSSGREESNSLDHQGSPQAYFLDVLCLVTQSTLRNPMNCIPPGFSVHGDSPGKNTGVGWHALLQGIFLTQGSNPDLLHCRWSLCCLSHWWLGSFWKLTQFSWVSLMYTGSILYMLLNLFFSY